jgi:hypothetical protein
MAQNYKMWNTVLLVIITALCGEIYLLNEKLSEMIKLVQSFNDKIEKMANVQKDLVKTSLDKQDTIKGGTINAALSSIKSSMEDFEQICLELEL